MIIPAVPKYMKKLDYNMKRIEVYETKISYKIFHRDKFILYHITLTFIL